MMIHCPKCGTFVELRDPRVTLHCRFCAESFAASKLEARRFWRERQEEWLRQSRVPWSFGGSVAVCLVTLLLLLGVAHGTAHRDSFSLAAAFGIPAWVTLLTLGAWAIHRLDHIGSLKLLYRTSLATLAVLALPVLYMLLPPAVRPGRVAERVMQVATGELR